MPVLISARPSSTLSPRTIPTDDLLDGLKALLSIGFGEHDARLRECILSAIDDVETYTGLLLYPADATTRYRELYGSETLPYGPVADGTTITATGLTGTALESLITAEAFPVVIGDYRAGISLSYRAGYELDQWPPKLREAVLQCAAQYFDNMERVWKRPAADYRRRTWAS